MGETVHESQALYNDPTLISLNSKTIPFYVTNTEHLAVRGNVIIRNTSNDGTNRDNSCVFHPQLQHVFLLWTLYFI